MKWACPVCGREFKNRNQSHSCEVRELESHFWDKDAIVFEIYSELISSVKKFGKININPVKNAIIIHSNKSFLAVKPKKQFLDIEFLLDYQSDYKMIKNKVQASKSRFAHFVRLTSKKDFTNRLINLLKESYTLNNK
jgi:hypothetical protein